MKRNELIVMHYSLPTLKATTKVHNCDYQTKYHVVAYMEQLQKLTFNAVYASVTVNYKTQSIVISGSLYDGTMYNVIVWLKGIVTFKRMIELANATANEVKTWSI